MEATKRRSRLHPKPRKTKVRGKVSKLRISPRDVEIFRVLARYRYLPINFLHPLLPDGGNYQSVQMRLTDLAGARYVSRPEQQWDSYNAFYKHIVYELGPKGKEYLAAQGLDYGHQIGTGASYHHEALTCLIVASMELHAKDFEFVHWPELLTYKMVPTKTKEADYPFSIPIHTGHAKHLIPDAYPFVIKGNRTLCFPGIETDMSNENLTGTRRVTIKKKFEGYLDIAARKTFKTHYGFPNMIVPFVTTSERRMKNMMSLLNKVTNGKGCTFIIFKYAPHLREVGKSPDPIDLISGPWERVGHPPFDLIEQLNKK